jgi:HAE1 family hydrophobic/amphiphilic exporter-1
MITMLIMVFLVFGLIAYFGLSLNLMPDAEIPFVTIQTIYPGAGPKEIETQITKKVEDAVSTVSKIDYIESYSMENVSIVTMRFELDKDIDIATQEVKQKVDAIINEFPNDVEKPSIDKLDINAQSIMNLILTGDIETTKLYEIADKQLKDRFSQIEGVAKVDITGGREREIHVELDDKVVFQNNISISQLSQIIAAQNLDMPGGQFTQKEYEYSVRLDGEFNAVNTLKQLDIPTAFGVKKLRQLANVTDSGSDVRKRSIYFDNIEKIKEHNVISIGITKSPEGNPVEISEEVRKQLPAIQKDLPEGTALKIIDDNSRFIKSSVEDTLMNVLLGIIFTGLVLLFFLHDLRSTIIVAIAMPTSIISTFLLMQVADFSLNILSLMGLSTSVGILVTNSVVVLENIFRHKEMGNTRKQASNLGTTEIAVAVIASTLTNIVVFLPLATMNTIVGQFLKEFALTVVFATMFSLLISFTVTPMLSSLILPQKQKKSSIGVSLEKMFHSWERGYAKTLQKILHNKASAIGVLAAAFLVFIVVMGTVAPRLGFEFMPKVDEGNINISFELPEGYNLEESAQMYDKIEKQLRQFDQVKNILVTLGKQGFVDEAPNLASIDVKLIDVEERELSTDQVANQISQQLADIPNVKLKVMVESSMGGGLGSDIEFYLMGQDMAILETLKQEIMQKADQIEGLTNFDSSSRPGKPELTLVPKRDKIAAAGVSLYDLALTLRASVEGNVATKYRDDGEEYDIKVSLSSASVDTPEEIRNIPVITPLGAFRMSQLADIEYTKGSTKIIHRDKYKTIQFTGAVALGGVQSDIINQLETVLADLNLPEGYKLSWGGQSENMKENNSEMAKAFMIAILLTYMLLAAILESFSKPILILLTLPLALIGVILALYITNSSLNFISMMGVIMLLGIVVNAAILLLDYTQQLREKGNLTKNALIEACPTKLKPILMSSIAIIMGMLPMALGIGASGAELRQPLGIVSIGGLIVATFLTLYVIPAFYYLTTHAKLKKIEKV